MNESLNHPELDSPPESAMLKAAYRNSGLTVADLASATGLSVGTVHIALNGIRYRDGKAKVAIPPDRTLVKLASALRIHPDVLRVHDRARAADLLVEASRVEAGEEVSFASEREAQAAVAGRYVLARQVLAAFSDEELRAELERRDRSEQILMHRQDEADLAETLTTDRWPL
ncbi:helix-turn-helix domain-containing protein [Arthrobacter sp. 49Tsu3.1M3]|uniref:helix-turn-helix domain-containing protein n=1 Tax=Arthrobacter sp. 49Tsu3.1M3 TaxID=1279029 RepID=UPI0011781BAE|nr:helix-turn-helix transcriptional regulator [Arthrobacter sp. 49Tsu3.1M3]